MARIGGNPRLKLVDQDFDPNQSMDVLVGDEAEGLPDTFTMGLDGEVSEGSEPANDDEVMEFSSNLATSLPQDYLNNLGEDIADWVEQDIQERQPWRDRFLRGLEIMGLVESDIDDGPFPGASNAVHPMIVEAVTQFWARAFAELYPPDGPAKSKIFGKQSQEGLDRGMRVAEYLNYEMTSLDEGFYPESSRLVWAVAFQGCAFKKTYRDPVLDRTIGVFVPAEDLIVPAEASDLKTAPRYTHRMYKTKNDLRRLQLVGHYADVELQEPTIEDVDEIKDIKAETMDVVSDNSEEDVRHEIFETSIELDIPGHEHMGPDGAPSGLEIPYVVTVEKHSRKVLAIYRNWDEADKLCRRKVYFDKYSFVPGMGFYDYGFIHLIGGLQTAVTGALRVMLDGAAQASITGGFVAGNTGLKGENLVIEPGKWKAVKATGDDLKTAFFSPPVKEPSPALFQLMGFLEAAGQRFSATTELQTGGGDSKNAPVGSTLAMIEQGQKVMSTIHALMHKSLGSELRLRYELAQRYKPQEGYPYDVQGEPRTVYSDDFRPGVSIVPVSDPNIFSSVQRISMAQAIYTIAKETGIVSLKKAARRMFEAMRVPDIDDLLPKDEEPQAYDPNGEIQAILMGKGVLVRPEQPHVEHLQVLAAFAANPGYGAHPEVEKIVGPALQSVIGQHLAYAWASAARMQQVPVGYMDPESGQMMQPPGPQGGPGAPPMGGEQQGMQPMPMAPPEIIAQLLAEIAPALQQTAGLPQPPQAAGAGNDAAAAAQKLAHADQAHQQAMQQKAQQRDLDVQAEQQKAAIRQQSDMNSQALKTQGEIERAQIKTNAAQQDLAIKVQKHHSEQAMRQQVDEHTLASKEAATMLDLQGKSEAASIASADRQAALADKQSAAELAAADREHSTALGAADREHASSITAAGNQMGLADKEHATRVGQQDREHAATTKKADRNAALKSKQAAANAKPAAKSKPKKAKE